MSPIEISTLVHAEPARAWAAYTSPVDICAWNAASPDWHTPRAEVDLRVGGRFLSRMEARDGSMGFDFEGTYQVVEAPHRLAYVMPDGRKVEATFQAEGAGTRVTVVFDPEGSNPRELQQAGWQAILDSFGRYVAAR